MNLAGKSISELREERETIRASLLENVEEQKRIRPSIGKLENGMPTAMTQMMKLQGEGKQLAADLIEIDRHIYDFNRNNLSALGSSEVASA